MSTVNTGGRVTDPLAPIKFEPRRNYALSQEGANDLACTIGRIAGAGFAGWSGPGSCRCWSSRMRGGKGAFKALDG